MSRKWTEAEIEILKEKYHRIPLSDLARMLRRTEGAIKARVVGYKIGMPEIKFNCAYCGRYVVAGGIHSNGRPDMRKRFCCAECEKKYWRHPPHDRESSRQNFSSIRQYASWEKMTNE